MQKITFLIVMLLFVGCAQDTDVTEGAMSVDIVANQSSQSESTELSSDRSKIVFEETNNLQTLSKEQLHAWIEQGNPDFVVLDIRTVEEYTEGHIPGAVNYPHMDILADVTILESLKGKQLVVHCRSGRRVGLVEQAIIDYGFIESYHLSGDYLDWINAELPIEK